MPSDHRFRSIRLRHYDYAQEGLYFITLCTARRMHLFGNVLNGEMHLTDDGRIVADEWTRTPEVRPYVTLDVFVVMPDHFHGIIAITQRQDDAHGVVVGPVKIRVAHTVGSIVRGFKAAASKRIGYSVWQRNYYETIIRSEEHLENVRQYITNNPRRWFERESSQKP